MKWTDEEKKIIREAYEILNKKDPEYEGKDEFEGMDMERLLQISSYTLFMILERSDKEWLEEQKKSMEDEP